MPRPKTKTELLELSKTNYTRLLSFVESFSQKEQAIEFPHGTMNRNMRDVLAHLYEWHLMMLKWYEVGMTGEKPVMPAPGYSWKQSSELNHKIWEKYQSYSLKRVKNLLEGTHHKIRAIIEKHTNDDLFSKKKYQWTGSTSLGAYLVSSTSSHYDWAYKLIKKCMKGALVEQDN